MQDFLVWADGYSWPLMLIGFVGCVLMGFIAYQAMEIRDNNSLNSEAWNVAVRRQHRLIPWTALFLFMFATGYAMPEPNYDVREVEKVVIKPNSYEELFTACMGQEADVRQWSDPDDIIKYQRERAVRAGVCQTQAREESQRQAIKDRASEAANATPPAFVDPVKAIEPPKPEPQPQAQPQPEATKPEAVPAEQPAPEPAKAQ